MDAVYSLPEMEGHPNSFQATRRDDGGWDVVHFYLKGVYKVCLIESNNPPKEDNKLNWADGDPDT